MMPPSSTVVAYLTIPSLREVIADVLRLPVLILVFVLIKDSYYKNYFYFIQD